MFSFKKKEPAPPTLSIVEENPVIIDMDTSVEDLIELIKNCDLKYVPGASEKENIQKEDKNIFNISIFDSSLRVEIIKENDKKKLHYHKESLHQILENNIEKSNFFIDNFIKIENTIIKTLPYQRIKKYWEFDYTSLSRYIILNDIAKIEVQKIDGNKKYSIILRSKGLKTRTIDYSWNYNIDDKQNLNLLKRKINQYIKPYYIETGLAQYKETKKISLLDNPNEEFNQLCLNFSQCNSVQIIEDLNFLKSKISFYTKELEEREEDFKRLESMIKENSGEILDKIQLDNFKMVSAILEEKRKYLKKLNTAYKKVSLKEINTVLKESLDNSRKSNVYPFESI